MSLQSVWEFISNHSETLISVGITALLFLKAMVSQKLTFREAMIVLANTLQDEKKLVAGQFTTATVTKIDNVGQAAGASPSAVEAARQTITTINQAVANAQPATPATPAVASSGSGDIKVGSMNGRPIYLGQVVGWSAQAKAAMDVFARIFGKK